MKIVYVGMYVCAVAVRWVLALSAAAAAGVSGATGNGQGAREGPNGVH